MADDFDVQRFARGINELLVLSTLREGPRHGYQIALDVDRASDGLFTLQHGTLYPILHRLERDGLIAGRWARVDGRRRKVYEMTAAGARHLSGETGRMQRVMRTLLTLLRGPGHAPA